jgi:uncharacterized membrane protein
LAVVRAAVAFARAAARVWLRAVVRVRRVAVFDGVVLRAVAVLRAVLLRAVVRRVLGLRAVLVEVRVVLVVSAICSAPLP